MLTGSGVTVGAAGRVTCADPAVLTGCGRDEARWHRIDRGPPGPAGREGGRRDRVDLRGRGVGVLLTPHLIGDVERVCDRVVVLDHGRAAAAGTLAELLGRWLGLVAFVSRSSATPRSPFGRRDL